MTQGGTIGKITETDGSSYFIAYVTTGTFPNGTGTITNTTNGGSAINGGWSVYGGNSFSQLSTLSNTSSSALGAAVDLGYSTSSNSNGSGGYFEEIIMLEAYSHIYIEYDGPNTSFDPDTSGASLIYNNLGGTATPLWSNNTDKIVAVNLVGNWVGATQVWSNVHNQPVTITDTSDYIIHTLTKTITNI